jgi:hypothetical protein
MDRTDAEILGLSLVDVEDIRVALGEERREASSCEAEDEDVRLQVYERGGWAIHSGPCDYDQNHRGYWGSGSVRADMTDAGVITLADDLIGQAAEHKALSGGAA